MIMCKNSICQRRVIPKHLLCKVTLIMKYKSERSATWAPVFGQENNWQQLQVINTLDITGAITITSYIPSLHTAIDFCIDVADIWMTISIHPKPVSMLFKQRILHVNARLKMYKYCYSNIDTIYAKGLLAPSGFVCSHYNILSPQSMLRDHARLNPLIAGQVLIRTWSQIIFSG